MMVQIDLAELTQGRIRNLTGHERGLAARRKFGLDGYDSDADPVTVHVPDDLDGITTSFFQGMFAASVRAQKDRFLDHYHFDASPAIMAQILRGIERVKTRRGSALA